MKEKFNVEIAGVKLGLVSEEGKEYVDSVCASIEERLTQLMRSQRNCSLLEAALFCALDLYSSSEANEKKLKNLEAQVALYQVNVTRLKRENEELQTKLRNAEK